jgi:hypothetical protein
MKLNVSGNTQLSDIRAYIRDKFQYLDIAFFESEHHHGEGNMVADKLPYSMTAAEAGDLEKRGTLELDSNTLVGDLEAAFHKQFGLHTQILRKSGDVWLQTTTSDNYTLTDLNNSAKEAAEFRPDHPEPEDYQEQE